MKNLHGKEFKMINLHVKSYLTSLIIKVSLNVSIILMMIKNIENAQFL